VSCQCVISGRRVGREAGRERVAYDVMRPKALWKRDEVAGVGSGSGRRAGVGSIRGSPYNHPPSRQASTRCGGEWNRTERD